MRLPWATLALQSEKGVFGSSWKGIAERADVSVVAVYKHFPSLEESVPACRELVEAITRPLRRRTPHGIFAGSRTLEERPESLGSTGPGSPRLATTDTAAQMEGVDRMSEENKAVVRRYCEEAVNQRNLDILDEIFASEFVDHSAPPGQESGTESLKQFFAMIDAGFPDFQVIVEDLFAEGEKVAVRFTFLGTHEGEFMGIAPTGKRVAMAGIDILRVVEGRIAELWGQEDMLGMMQQLGAIASPEESPY